MAAETTKDEISFHAWPGGHWGVLFSHAAGFMPVCTTELGAVARRQEESGRRDTRMLALPADSLKSHLDWAGDIAETQGSAVEFPVIADPGCQVGRSLTT